MPRRRQSAFSLVELLIVVSIMGILVALAMPSLSPGIHDQLEATAEIVTGDLAYGRSLAVANNSSYRIRFDKAGNRYILEHSGTNAALDNLPPSPFRSPSDPPKQQIVDLAELPRVGGYGVRLAAAVTSPGGVAVTDLEFGPLGQTTRSQETIVWLAAGSGAEARYLSVRVNPVTGLTTPGEFTSTPPANVQTPAATAAPLPLGP